ncbi:MAG: hypothetical protein EBX36_06245 [Planctomycetia bacterium]|nr:hypothetical protein [Planctomycetia bacterium]
MGVQASRAATAGEIPAWKPAKSLGKSAAVAVVAVIAVVARHSHASGRKQRPGGGVRWNRMLKV